MRAPPPLKPQSNVVFGGSETERIVRNEVVVFGLRFAVVPAVRVTRITARRRRTFISCAVSVQRGQLIVTGILKRNHRIRSDTVVLIYFRPNLTIIHSRVWTTINCHSVDSTCILVVDNVSGTWFCLLISDDGQYFIPMRLVYKLNAAPTLIWEWIVA